MEFYLLPSLLDSIYCVKNFQRYGINWSLSNKNVNKFFNNIQTIASEGSETFGEVQKGQVSIDHFLKDLAISDMGHMICYNKDMTRHQINISKLKK